MSVMSCPAGADMASAANRHAERQLLDSLQAENLEFKRALQAISRCSGSVLGLPQMSPPPSVTGSYASSPPSVGGSDQDVNDCSPFSSEASNTNTGTSTQFYSAPSSIAAVSLWESFASQSTPSSSLHTGGLATDSMPCDVEDCLSSTEQHGVDSEVCSGISTPDLTEYIADEPPALGDVTGNVAAALEEVAVCEPLQKAISSELATAQESPPPLPEEDGYPSSTSLCEGEEKAMRKCITTDSEPPATAITPGRQRGRDEPPATAITPGRQRGGDEPPATAITPGRQRGGDEPPATAITPGRQRGGDEPDLLDASSVSALQSKAQELAQPMSAHAQSSPAPQRIIAIQSDDLAVNASSQRHGSRARNPTQRDERTVLEHKQEESGLPRQQERHMDIARSHYKHGAAKSGDGLETWWQCEVGRLYKEVCELREKNAIQEDLLLQVPKHGDLPATLRQQILAWQEVGDGSDQQQEQKPVADSTPAPSLRGRSFGVPRYQTAGIAVVSKVPGKPPPPSESLLPDEV